MIEVKTLYQIVPAVQSMESSLTESYLDFTSSPFYSNSPAVSKTFLSFADLDPQNVVVHNSDHARFIGFGSWEFIEIGRAHV